MILVSQTHPPIILFDFDGVIITHTSLELAALKQLKNKWYNWKNTENMRLIDFARIFEQSDSKNKRKAFTGINRSYKNIIPNYFKRWFFFVRFRLDYPKLEKIYDTLKPNLEDTLKLFKENRFPMGIVSNTGKERLEYFSTKFELDNYFSVLFSRSDTEIRKPSPYPIILALKTIKEKFNLPKIDKSMVYYIGDLPSDIICANAAGINSVATISGHGLKEDLVAENPTLVINEIKDLLKVEKIKKFLKK